MYRTIQKNLANAITSVRIVCAVALLFAPSFSAWFYVLYLTAGLSDMIDGTVARKTQSVGAFGARLDTVADLAFVAACMVRLLPILEIPTWLWIALGCIAAVKAANIVAGLVRYRRFTAVHTVLNKVTGFLLFLFPLTLPVVNLRYGAGALCVVAAVAAVQEGYDVYVGKIKE